MNKSQTYINLDRIEKNNFMAISETTLRKEHTEMLYMCKT